MTSPGEVVRRPVSEIRESGRTLPESVRDGRVTRLPDGRLDGHPGAVFEAPTVHLLIVDDDQDEWAPWLERSFEDYLANWWLYQRGFFRCEVVQCRSKEGFRRAAEDLLKAGQPVYAAVDLYLPRSDDEKPDRKRWQELVLWCLRQLESVSSRRRQFDFCVMSGEESKLAELYSDADSGRALRRHGIKKISKAEVSQSPVREARLAALWDDVRNFVRSQVDGCRIPERFGKETWEKLVWFGDHPRVSELRYQADRIASHREGGLFLMLSDGSGYVEDWFHLVCHLRGTPADSWRILAVADVRPDHDPDWAEDLDELPECLLVTGVEWAADRGCDLAGVLRDFGTLGKIRERRSLVFVQFPHVRDEDSLRLRLDPEEREVLDLCLEHLGGSGGDAGEGFRFDSGFAYSKHPQIIHFPEYEELKDAGVIRRTIEFDAAQCRERFDLPDHPLDPEVATVLGEIRWDQEMGGLFGLRSSIRRAFSAASRSRESLDRYVGESHFNAKPVRAELQSTSGFGLRGRRLFERLSTKPWTILDADPDQEMLVDLAGVHDVYERLHRLMELHSRLEADNKATTSPEFPYQQFEALRRAHDFLRRVFGSPERLRKVIERFRKTLEDPDRRVPTSEIYPSLRDREDWRELVDNMRFVWPYDVFPLPRSIDVYLRHSKVVAELHPDFERILGRYPHLAERWNRLEEQRTELREELQERETQRWNAERFVREMDSQPVCVPLSAEPEHRRQPAAAATAFDATLRSLLYFNANLALCEDHYRFEGKFVPRKAARKYLNRPDIGPSNMMLGGFFGGAPGYAGRLEEAGRLGESVFARWTDSWAKDGSQPDAVRVIRRIARALESTVREEDGGRLAALLDLPDDAGSCPLLDVLDLFRVIRNSKVKPLDYEFWSETGELVWDLLRRFVAATTDPRVRLGFVDGEDRAVQAVWSRRGPVRRREDAARPDGVSGGLAAVREPELEVLFPLDNLLRVNPEDWSVWVPYSDGQDWYRLTLGDGDPKRLPGSESPWLPSAEEFRSSEVWRAYHG